MRDQRFVAEHRGGPLRKVLHRRLMLWACDCAEHVLPLLGDRIDERLHTAIRVAKAWERGNATVGEARAASLAAISAARESPDPAAVAVARSVAQAAATAHMADHSLGAAWYALKAVRHTGRSVDAERMWQDARLPRGIRSLVLTARRSRGI